MINISKIYKKYEIFSFTLLFKVLFMEENIQSVEAIKDIRRMMERSSRFISLSGLSGISAGICALIGAWIAIPYVYGRTDNYVNPNVDLLGAIQGDYSMIFNKWLFWIALGTFVAAFVSAFIFTWIKSKKEGIPIWGSAAKRLMINVCIPLAAGGLFIFKMMHFGTFGLVAPGCLIFYGLALINASKYTLTEIRYLGYCQIILGLVNLCFVGCGLYFWAFGFGIMHIVYGIYMWTKYERK